MLAAGVLERGDIGVRSVNETDGGNSGRGLCSMTWLIDMFRHELEDTQKPLTELELSPLGEKRNSNLGGEPNIDGRKGKTQWWSMVTVGRCTLAARGLNIPERI